ncbi:MAG: cytochrome c oxidase assembly factor CtaG [Paenibacillus sp.]|uniref:Putative membrane protein n=1 Tax=Paenibacillus aquistagni TaxID=1852522 RepID=A0A1X7LAW7_9BACL|nr:cytochrome c oxidase assembly factor CtaG [Paenibacillus aquistagni]MBR2570109.1 cytochrome c oxidase assembly factor CtaG [Paenibacillus sp.]SMG50687.1 putative membrane protein [Paenibacillus aquistagni]
MFGLESFFSFSDLWSPLMLIATVLIIILYLGLTGPFRQRFADSTPVPPFRKGLFIIGVLLLYFVQGGPVNVLSHMMFTFHMIMMSISYIIVPPLLMLGIPSWLWRFMLDRAFVKKLNWLMHPILTAVLFNTLFSLYHVPAVHDYVMLNYDVHILYYIALFIASMMMWWPVVSPVPEWPGITHVKKMGYIFLNGVLITPACALIIFAGDPLYSTYTDPDTWALAMGYCVAGDPSQLISSFGGPEFFNWFDPVEDQQLGGIVMKLIQETMYGAILAYVFSQWFRKEGKDDDDVVESTLDGHWKQA